MAETLKRAAGLTANALPIYRVYRGKATAERLRDDMRPPENRTWHFAGRVAFDVSTDFIDGRLARYAGATRIGGYLDQLSDKAWFLLITRQLTANGEIEVPDLYLPLARDVGTLILRPVAQYYGLHTDASLSGKIKMATQSLAAVSACSPLANDYPEFVQGLYRAATIASAVSGADLLVQYNEEFKERYKTEPLPQVIGEAAVQLAAAA